MSGSLFFHGKSRPPRTSRRRGAWAGAVLLLSAVILPFVVTGAIEAWRESEYAGALAFLVIGASVVTAAIASLIVLARHTSLSRRKAP